MVIPLSFSSGALSIESNERNSERPFFANTVVIAAVKSSFTVVNVTDSTNIYVWFGPVKMFFSHNSKTIFIIKQFISITQFHASNSLFTWKLPRQVRENPFNLACKCTN